MRNICLDYGDHINRVVKGTLFDLSVAILIIKFSRSSVVWPQAHFTQVTGSDRMIKAKDSLS